MPASVVSPADVINLALVRIGYHDRIANLYDGSDQSKNALDCYSQTRDSVLRQSNWGFAERNVALTLLKSAPPNGYIPGVTPWTTAYPPPPWLFEYTYPDDCLKVRAVKGVPIFLPNVDPRPNLYGLENDNAYSPARKVILCNVPDAFMVYTGQVTNPATWEADFVEEVAAALGRRLVAVLMGGSSGLGPAQDEAVSMQIAQMNQG